MALPRAKYFSLYQVLSNETSMRDQITIHTAIFVEISRIFLQIGNMNLLVHTQYPKTNKLLAKLQLGSQESVGKVSVFKIFLLTKIN